MKKHIVLIILGGALLMIGIILSFNKKNEIIYYYDEVELSQEEASSLILEKTRNIVDIYENKDNTFKLVEEKKEAPTSDNTEDVFAKIEKLNRLKEMGAITEEEYNSKKSELLAKI